MTGARAPIKLAKGIVTSVTVCIVFILHIALTNGRTDVDNDEDHFVRARGPPLEDSDLAVRAFELINDSRTLV